MTTQRYFTPSGRSIQAKGIDPDIVVEQARLEPFNNRNLEHHEEDLRGALKNKSDDDGNVNQNKRDPKSSENIENKLDYQLDRAVDLLQGIALYGKTDR